MESLKNTNRRLFDETKKNDKSKDQYQFISFPRSVRLSSRDPGGAMLVNAIKKKEE